MKRLAVMYSGGTDSTAAVVLLAEQYDEIHLITCTHSGLKYTEYSERNVQRLRRRYGTEKFIHVYLEMDALWRRVTYDDYWANVRKHGVMNLTSCGLCKVAMHLRALLYCLDHGITEIADGANRNMSHSPEQMREVLEELRRMYARFGVTYSNPVYEHDFPTDMDWFHKLGVPAVAAPGIEDSAPRFGRTTGQVVHEAGLAPNINVKGSAYDRQMQARCFQLSLLNVASLGYYIPTHGADAYREAVQRFYREKVAVFADLVEQYTRDRERSELHVLLTRKLQPERLAPADPEHRD